jgi:phosphoribosylanthranilate isomerase
MHICGKWARDLMAGEMRWDVLPPIRAGVQRVQINGETPLWTRLSASALAAEMSMYGAKQQLVFQYPRAGQYMRACQEQGLNCAPLFDESGGEGRQVRAWDGMVDSEYVGYAGGIGPDDVTETVGGIMAFRSGAFWIDMEGRVRDSDDRLDMKKVGHVLEACQRLIDGPVFDGLMVAAERKQVAKNNA